MDYRTPPADSEPSIGPYIPGTAFDAGPYDVPEGSQRYYSESTPGTVTDYLDVDDPEFAIGNPLGEVIPPPLAGSSFGNQDEFVAIPEE